MKYKITKFKVGFNCSTLCLNFVFKPFKVNSKDYSVFQNLYHFSFDETSSEGGEFPHCIIEEIIGPV